MKAKIEVINKEDTTSINILHLNWNEYARIMLCLKTIRKILDTRINDSIYYEDNRLSFAKTIDSLFNCLPTKDIPSEGYLQGIEETTLIKCLNEYSKQ